MISSIPLLAYSNTSSLGCTAVVIAAEFRGQGAASEDSWLRLSAPLAASLRSHTSRRAVFLPPAGWDSLRSCDPDAQRPDREVAATGSAGALSPGGSSLAPCVTRRPSPAAPGASTPAGRHGEDSGQETCWMSWTLPCLSCCPHKGVTEAMKATTNRLIVDMPNGLK